MSLEIGFDYSDQSNVSKLYADADNTYYQMGGMDGYFAIKNQNIYSQIKKSPLVDEDDLEYELDTDFSLNWFGDEIIEFEDGRKYGISDESEQKLQDQLYDAMQVTKNGSQDVTIGGKNRKAKKYQVVIAKSDLKDYVDSVKDVYMDEVFDVMYSGYPDEWKDELEEDAEDSFDMIKDAIDDDLQMEVYVYNNEVAGFVIDLALEEDDDEIKVHGEGYNEGADNILTDFRYEFSAEIDKDEAYGIKLEKETTENSGDVEENIEILLYEEWGGDYDDEYTITMNTEIEGGSEFTFEIEGEDDWGDEDLFFISGDIVSVKKGKSFELSIDKIEADGEELEKLEASVYMSNNTSEAAPETIDSGEDVCFILEVDEDEALDFVEEHVDEDDGALGEFLSRSKKADDLAAAQTINTAVSAAFANEDVYYEWEEYGAPDASEYSYYDDQRVDIIAEAEPGEEFEAAPGIDDSDISTFLDEINASCGGASPEIKYTGDSGYGKPDKWAVGVGYDDCKPYIFIATDDDYFAYELQPDICYDYQ